MNSSAEPSSSTSSSYQEITRATGLSGARFIQWSWLEKLSKSTSEFMHTLEMCSRQGIHKVDFELLLEKLTNTKAQENDGKLIWVPVFFNLPTIAQTRLLYILQANISQISHHSLFKFIEVVKTSENKWVQEMIRQLAKLTDKKTSYSLHSDFPPYAVSIKETENLNRNDIRHEERDPKLDMIVDVIVIDDDVSENSSNTQISNTAPIGALQMKRKLQDPRDKLDQMTTVAAITSSSKVLKSNLHSLDRDCAVNSRSMSLQQAGYEDIVSECDKLSPAVETKPSLAETLIYSNEDKNQTDLIVQEPESKSYSTELIASFCPQVKFNQLCNACQSQDMDMTLEMLTPFTDLTLSEIKQVCESLDFAHLSEKMIVNIFDYMPWQNLSSSAASIILDSCLVTKLCELTSEPTDRLLSAVMLIASCLSHVLVDVFIKVLLATNSGYSQCQLITSISKDSLALEQIDYFIRQIVKQKVVCNDDLISVLQVLIDRTPGLDDVNLKLLLSLLSQHTSQCQTSKFGKLLLSIMTRYGTMMSSEHLVVINAIINGHTSNLKKVLVSAMKKIQQKQTNS